MCYTYRHDFGLIVDNDEAMYSLSGITRNERQRIWNTMAQIYDNDIAPMLEDYRQVNEGEAITLPKSSNTSNKNTHIGFSFLVMFIGRKCVMNIVVA